MGLFDFFKKKENTQQEQQALDTGLEKTKDNFFPRSPK
jgi:fused signal recognition particle receptor